VRNLTSLAEGSFKFGGLHVFNTWYCQLSKLVSTIGMIIFLLVIIFIIFAVLRALFSKGGGGKSFFLKMAK
jgi:hypothetical protein